MSIIVIPGLIQLFTYCRTCRWASAACRKSFHISSLALSNTCFSSLLIRQAALRLRGPKTLYDVAITFIYLKNNHNRINTIRDERVNIFSSHYLDWNSLIKSYTGYLISWNKMEWLIYVDVLLNIAPGY